MVTPPYKLLCNTNTIIYGYSAIKFTGTQLIQKL